MRCELVGGTNAAAVPMRDARIRVEVFMVGQSIDNGRNGDRSEPYSHGDYD